MIYIHYYIVCIIAFSSAFLSANELRSRSNNNIPVNIRPQLYTSPTASHLLRIFFSAIGDACHHGFILISVITSIVIVFKSKLFENYSKYIRDNSIEYKEHLLRTLWKIMSRWMSNFDHIPYSSVPWFEYATIFIIFCSDKTRHLSLFSVIHRRLHYIYLYIIWSAVCMLLTILTILSESNWKYIYTKSTKIVLLSECLKQINIEISTTCERPTKCHFRAIAFPQFDCRIIHYKYIIIL